MLSAIVRVFGVAASAVPLMLLGACASDRPPNPMSAPLSACRKLDPELANLLSSKSKDDRVRVVVELSRAPRERDMLQAGVTACTPSESLAVQHNASPDVSWGEYESGAPAAVPVMCFSLASRREVARWCGDPTFRRIEAWH